MLDKTSVRILKKNEVKNDFAFWQAQPNDIRLKALELIREEFNSWKYDNKQGFQRVFKITKRA